jgi:hypothetical protein
MQSEDHEFARMMARVAAHEAFDAAAAREQPERRAAPLRTPPAGAL